MEAILFNKVVKVTVPCFRNPGQNAQSRCPGSHNPTRAGHHPANILPPLATAFCTQTLVVYNLRGGNVSKIKSKHFGGVSVSGAQFVTSIVLKEMDIPSRERPRESKP